MKKMELNVAINCSKCKTQVVKAVAKLEGIDQVAVDAEKGILTVVGEVDPVRVTKQVRKTGKHAEIISVGAVEKSADSAKPDSGKSSAPPLCSQCHVYISVYDSYDQCTIL